jgi:hypothetical protein
VTGKDPGTLSGRPASAGERERVLAAYRSGRGKRAGGEVAVFRCGHAVAAVASAVWPYPSTVSSRASARSLGQGQAQSGPTAPDRADARAACAAYWAGIRGSGLSEQIRRV